MTLVHGHARGRVAMATPGGGGGKNFSSFQEYLRKCVVTFFCDIIKELMAVCLFKIRTYLQHVVSIS